MSRKFTYRNKAYGIDNYEIDLYWVNIYQSLFRSMVHKYEMLFSFLNDEFIVASRKVNKYSKVARQEMNNEMIDQELKEKIDQAILSFNRIGMDLQYHDIIRQKVEHISSIEKHICKELELIYNNEKGFNPRFTLILNELVELFVNQFLKIKSDYVTATSNIQRSLFSLWTDRNLARRLKLLLFSTSSQLKNITRTLDEIILTHQQMLKKSLEYKIEMNDEMKTFLFSKVTEIYTMEEEREIFNKTFQIKEISEKVTVENEEDFDDILF